MRIDWNEVVSKYKLNYIIGNPPFVGSQLRTPKQREDMDLVFGKNFKRHGILDYVAAWFKKASDYMKITQIGFYEFDFSEPTTRSFMDTTHRK